MIDSLSYPFIIIDGTSYLYRAYYAFPFLKNVSGEPTGAIYCVLNMLSSLLSRYNPSHVAVVFDYGRVNFRNKLFKYYKIHRPFMPEDLYKQIIPLQTIIKAMGLRILVVSGVEADDTIGTLTLLRKNHVRVLISTCDKDIAQLVSEEVFLFNLISKTVFGSTEIFVKFGVFPNCFVDYLALVGDYSDNIPGIPGIGKKIAKILLCNFGNLKNIYKNLEKIYFLNIRNSKSIILTLKKNYNVALLSYQLAKIKTDVAINVSYENLIVDKPKFDILYSLFRKYEFKNWLNVLKNKKWPWKFYNKMS
ncbi:MAG: DNA polymerase I [Candidatus Westeberhardia cardiocondylae]|nr:DNA polymerase I [Candidatus Westeberhardia cardiocondylae]